MLIMAALCNRAGHYIFALWFLLFFPRLISAVADWMSTILLHKNAGLKCAARGLLEMQKSPKSAILAPSHNFVGLYFHN